DLVDLAPPAMKLDRAHLNARQKPADIVEIEVILDGAVALLDRDMLHMRAERALVVLLEEAFAGAAARTANQRHRALRRVDHDQWLDHCIVIGEILLGELQLGEDNPLWAADF